MPSSLADILRFAVVVAILLLLARAARSAWSRRRLAVRIWRAIRPRHVVGSLALAVLVVGTVLVLLSLVPVSRIGLGSLVGLDGNAVFAPIDGALQAPLDQAIQAGSSGETPPGVPWLDVALVVSFLSGLLALFPHLAHAEEAAFRSGWEDLDLPGQVKSALRFGLTHLIMLIPVAAALAVSLAGFVYGRIYRRAYDRAAIPRAIYPAGRMALAEDAEGYTRLVMGPPAPVMRVDVRAARRDAVFEAAVWHTTFNSLVVVIVLIGYVSSL